MKYYKILNEKENHNYFKFKTGLNIDTIEFNNKDSCSPGGFYFAKEDILGFLDYGCWIREVTIPEDAMFHIEESYNLTKYKADKIILGKRRKIKLSVIKQLIADGANVKANHNCALRWASAKGHLEIVKILISNGANVEADDNDALRWASANGH